MRLVLCLLAPAAWLACTAARADIVISTKPTQNMTCSNAVCSPTAQDAVLNVSDLETFLASGAVSVTTTGKRGIQAGDIDVVAPFGWSAANALALDAFQSIGIGATVSVNGAGGLSLTTNDGGTGGVFSIGRKGSVLFQNLSSPLTINGTPYVLVNSLPLLASAILSNPDGAFAMANSYDASADGIYTASPIVTNFSGNLEGLGNSISNLSIKARGSYNALGLFSQIAGGSLEHLHLTHVKINSAKKDHIIVGAFAGGATGYLFEDTATGIIKFSGSQTIGGLVSLNDGTIEDCSASVTIVGTQAPSAAGGLVGSNYGLINESFSTGDVTVGRLSIAGGLAGTISGSTVEASYATGAVTGDSNSIIGGLYGEGIKNSINSSYTSYSTGAVSAAPSGKVGGFIGKSVGENSYYHNYWDTTTSGTDQAAGAGRTPGVSGLTTEQLKSGLPGGFDTKVWAEDSKINNGFPYLIDNPPEN